MFDLLWLRVTLTIEDDGEDNTPKETTMSNAMSAKTRAYNLIKRHLEIPGHTTEELFVEIIQQIEQAEQSAYSRGYETARRALSIDL
jgi:hypothetical protein